MTMDEYVDWLAELQTDVEWMRLNFPERRALLGVAEKVLDKARKRKPIPRGQEK